jgi:hypothetical protein
LEVHRHLGWRHLLLPPEILLADARAVAPGLLLPAPWARAFHAIMHWQIQDHGGSRRTLPLKEVLEIARFLARTDVDWAALSVRAELLRVGDECTQAIASAALLLNASVPGEIALQPASERWVARSIARRASPLGTWLATQIWRAGTLWRCEKVAYRCALRGMKPAAIHRAVWGARAVRLPLLAVRAIGITMGAVARLWGMRAGNMPSPGSGAQAAERLYGSSQSTGIRPAS